MLQSFIIVLREGFEAFLIVAVIAAYLKKTGRSALMPAVQLGIFISVATSVLFGYLMLQGSNEPLWEGWMGLISAVFITGFVIHMWRTAPHLKQDMELKLASHVEKSGRAAFIGVMLFTIFMITREGMETALLLMQVHSPQIVSGSLLGAMAAALLAFLWMRVGRLINLKLFFQVTALFLLLFVVQILIYSFHEFTEAGVFPNSEYWHVATEPYSPDGVYGRWISLAMVGVCGLWMLSAWAKDKFLKKA